MPHDDMTVGINGDPLAMRVRRETVEPPFGTLRATHFLTKTLPRISTEMALQVLAYNLTRVLNFMKSRKLSAAILASARALNLLLRG